MIIEQFTKQVKLEAETVRAVTYGADDQYEAQRNNLSIELPILEIPKFSEDPIEYRGFVKRFDPAMKLYSINYVQKCSQLKRYLVGEAQKIVVGMALTEAY